MNEPMPAQPAGPHDGAAMPAAAPGATPAAGDWRQSLPPELRDSPSFKHFKDVAALAKEHVNLQSLIGRKGVIPPGDNAKPEDYDRFYAALGRPADPKDYGFRAPADVQGYSEALAGDFAQAAHKSGLSAKQAMALHDWFVDKVRGASATLGEGETRGRANVETELRRDWGRDYDAKLAQAQRAIHGFAGQNAVEFLNRNLGDAEVIRMFQRIGALLGEDTVVSGAPRLAVSPEDAKLEIARTMGDPTHAYWNREHRDHKAAVLRMGELFTIRGAG